MPIITQLRLKILLTLAIAFILLQYTYVNFNEQNWFNSSIVTTVKKCHPSTNPVPLIHLNVSGIEAMIYNKRQTTQTNEKQFITLCPETPPDLNGTMRILVPAQETLEEVAQQLSWLKLLEGGHHEPLDCQARYKIAIIVPYRDRLSNLCTFLLNMHPFLTKQKLDYSIFIVEQFGDGLFNRAMLMNVGFNEALKLRDFDCFFFHDVDLIPENDRNIYSCPDQPRHMSVAIDKFNYSLPFVDLFGGVIGMSRNHFELVNGFSNNYWGWGAEDDDMACRVRAHGLNITRYTPDVARYRMLSHVNQESNPSRFEILRSSRERFNTDGLNSLEYRVKSLLQLPLFTYILTELSGGCN
ncbi:beta-1,4-N-acetylgalactosaminyltransferase bre-4-like [Sipha flava]|uniref:Beta-1,4-N-acetylgalactosaminyltransferase n=1 Tax=Sipha flava TaxID=143950 RepID=A0A8B8GKM8_9HEMI|nr:beta-1,4-N-acetylgalactosaminyltransferase bre-4-like [Sipha flava]